MNRQEFLYYAIAAFLSYNPTATWEMMPSQTIRIIIQQAKQAWLDGDAQAFADLFKNNGIFIVPGQIWQGKPAIIQAFQNFSEHNVVKEIVIRNIVIQNNQAMLEWYWEATETATEKISKAEDAIAIDFQDGQIQRWREYIDTSIQ